jgi:acyl-CoA synthetase (AMP-forming)/AMP-acid ligase II
MTRLWLLVAMLCLSAPAVTWEHWGGDAAGTRLSTLAQITPENVGSLVRGWEFRTGDVARSTRPGGDAACCGDKPSSARCAGSVPAAGAARMTPELDRSEPP